MSWFGKSVTGKPVCIVEIDDGSVGAAVAILSSGGRPRIIAAERVHLPFETRTSDQLLSALSGIISECVEKTLKKYLEKDAGKKHRAPNTVYAVLRAPWSEFRTARTDSDVPAGKSVTKDMIGELAKKALSEKADFDRTTILEAGVMQAFLNGYPTGEPIGKKAQKIGIVAFESNTNAHMQNAVREAIGKTLPGRSVMFFSGMRLLLTVLHEHIPDVQRYTILDVATSHTSAAVVRKELVTDAGMVPVGVDTLLNKATDGKAPPETTFSMLKMLAADTCSEPACLALKESIARAEPELVKVFAELTAKIAARRRVPANALLVARKEMVPWLQSFFGRIDFGQFTATGQPFTIEPLTYDHLQNILEWGNGVAPDTTLGIAVCGVNILEA